MTEQYMKSLTALVMSEHPNLGNGDSVLSLIYEVYNEHNNMDTAQIKAVYKAFYQAMNGKTLDEMDTVLLAFALSQQNNCVRLFDHLYTARRTHIHGALIFFICFIFLLIINIVKYLCFFWSVSRVSFNFTNHKREIVGDNVDDGNI